MLTERSCFAIIIFVPSEHAPIAQLDRAFDYESKGHRFESCWVHHEPPTSLALLAVVFYSFVFLCIVRFLKILSRALASFEEVEVRDFLLCFRTKFQVVFGVKACLSQKVSQSGKTTADQIIRFDDFLLSFVNIAVHRHFYVRQSLEGF